MEKKIKELRKSADIINEAIRSMPLDGKISVKYSEIMPSIEGNFDKLSAFAFGLEQSANILRSLEDEERKLGRMKFYNGKS